MYLRQDEPALWQEASPRLPRSVKRPPHALVYCSMLLDAPGSQQVYLMKPFTRAKRPKSAGNKTRRAGAAKDIVRIIQKAGARGRARHSRRARTYWGRVGHSASDESAPPLPAEQSRGADGVCSLTKDRRHLERKPFTREGWRVRRDCWNLKGRMLKVCFPELMSWDLRRRQR
jgi:hypothetical protein